MADFYDSITDELRAFIEAQHLFFVATAPLSGDGHINLSPKGLDSFRVLDPNRVAYLDMTGSGNETSAHLLQNGRITFMFCAFEGAARILRLYGRGETILPGSSGWDALAPHFTIYTGARQIILAHIDQAQTSCGYAVPLYDFKAQRETLTKYWEQRDAHAYQQEHNLRSLDDLPTDLGKDGISSSAR